MDIEPLELRRIKTDLTMYFKIYNNLSALPSDVCSSHVTIQCEPTIHGGNVSTYSRFVVLNCLQMTF